jgi:hypothetical protein
LKAFNQNPEGAIRIPAEMVPIMAEMLIFFTHKSGKENRQSNLFYSVFFAVDEHQLNNPMQSSIAESF